MDTQEILIFFSIVRDDPFHSHRPGFLEVVETIAKVGKDSLYGLIGPVREALYHDGGRRSRQDSLHTFQDFVLKSLYIHFDKVYFLATVSGSEIKGNNWNVYQLPFISPEATGV